jgi:hypothetical protein
MKPPHKVFLIHHWKRFFLESIYPKPKRFYSNLDHTNHTLSNHIQKCVVNSWHVWFCTIHQQTTISLIWFLETLDDQNVVTRVVTLMVNWPRVFVVGLAGWHGRWALRIHWAHWHATVHFSAVPGRHPIGPWARGVLGLGVHLDIHGRADGRLLRHRCALRDGDGDAAATLKLRGVSATWSLYKL